MALTAAVAAALAAVCAAAALQGVGGQVVVPPALFGLGLLPGIVLVALHPDRRVLAPDKERKTLFFLVGTAALLFYVTGTTTVEQASTVARLAILAVLPLSLLWPSPLVLRFCLLVSAGSLVAAASPPSGALWPIAGVAVGAAVTLVVLKRQGAVAALAARSAGPPASVPASRRRMATETATLLAVAAVVGLLVAALLPPPNPRGNPEAGDEPEESGEAAPYLTPSERLDAGQRGSGRGDDVVLRITAPGPSLWRSQTYDHWDGRAWTRSAGARSPVGPPQRRQAFVPPGPGETFSGGEPVLQRVRVEARSAGVLVAAARPVTVDVARGAVRVDADRTLRAVPPLGRGATYVVSSLRTDPTPEELRSTEPSDDLPDLYLQLPAGGDRVRALAVELAGDAATSYDGVLAVEEWLLTNTEVALGKAPLAAGANPVERFLFDERRGSPEQVASAMTVLLRSLGVPARLAVGFLPGDRYAVGGDFVVRSRHAHAWVEAWFPQAGWVSFDPSARLGSPDENDSFLDRLRRLLGALWWLLAVVLALAVRWLTLRGIRRWQRQRSRPWVTRCYERLVRAGGKGGRPRRPSETPVEYCTALARTIDDERLVEVGAMITAGAFSGREPPPESRAWVDQVVGDTERRSHRRRPSRGSVKMPPAAR